MKRISVGMGLVVTMVLCASWFVQAQQIVATNTNIVVPPLINFSGVLTDVGGKPLTNAVSITFSLYSEQTGGAALWMESQKVQPDSSGHYAVMLGSTSSQGLPADIFVSGQAHWLDVRVQGQEEQPRVLLVSAPYALKAGDAATIGGLPPSAFVMAAVPTGVRATASETDASSLLNSTPPPNPAITGLGTVGNIPLWDSTSDIINSVLHQSGTGTTAKIGINTTTPATTLDVKGSSTMRGSLSLPATGAATATAGKNSQPVLFTASAFNSSTSTAVNQKFQWQAEPANNDTSTASGTLNLLYGQGSGAVAETGLRIASNGRISFASGQTFPGTGNGTVTSVASGTGLTGGPITTSGTLSIDASKVPLLATANTFTANQTINAGLYASVLFGESSVAGESAVYGTNSATSLSGTNGVQGQSYSPLGSGTVGENYGGGYGVYGYGGTGVWGTTNNSSGYGVEGTNVNGIGLYGSGFTGMYSLGSNTGAYAYGDDYGVWGDTGTGWAGYFNGDIDVIGTVYGEAKDFKIDHPLDPENKYLLHTSVESSEMMNIYTGNVTTDSQGEASVQLPEWLEALNGDFRYQLTVIGQFAQAIVSREIQNHEFQIRTNLPNVKVSWQVTGVRQDAYAKAHPMQVEMVKPDKERGLYLNPELYGAPKEKGVAWATAPQAVKQLKEARAKSATNGEGSPAKP